MTDPVVLRAPRKSILRKRFRTVEREKGPGTIVAFANGRAAHVQECLTGLLSTGSITEPRYSDEGYAVVKILDRLDDETGLEHERELATQQIEAPAIGVGSFSDQAEAENFIAENASDEKAPPVPEDGSALVSHPTPPPTSGPGSGADAWRTYAAKITGTAFESWSKMSRAEIIADLEDKGTPVG